MGVPYIFLMFLGKRGLKCVKKMWIHVFFYKKPVYKRLEAGAP